MEVPFRITVLDPPRGVTFRVQRGRSDLVAPSSETATAIVFDFTLHVERQRKVISGSSARSPKAHRTAGSST